MRQIGMRSQLSLALVIVMTSQAIPCCLTFGRQVVSLTEETALIIWDEKNQTQSFVRRSTFKGKAKDFGFILPVPSKPTEITVSDSSVFQLLERQRPQPRKSESTSTKAAKPAGGVEVLEVKRVGDFEATVLRTDSGEAVNQWLSARGHNMRPAMRLGSTTTQRRSGCS